MRRDSLLDFFDDISHRRDPFLIHDDGYRTREASYDEVGRAARAFATRLVDAGIRPDDRIVIWSENRIEWVVALWGCLIARAVLVPVDYRASADLLSRIAAIVSAKVVLVGHEVTAPQGVTGRVWELEEAIPLASGLGPQASGNALPRSSTPHSAPGPAALSTTLAEIIFTSGATAEPKGVTITHRNILANIVPIEREMAKYRKYARPFHPIRFLNLLPLSHMFGQSMATFVPPMLSGTVVFSHGYSPAEILRQIKSRRISVLVCVPKVLDVLREHIERAVPMTTEPDPLAGQHWSKRWWHYRVIHRMFGWKFWCVVCGAAPLDPNLEAFWRKLGFLVVQGYGLTETAPIVTLNHPLRASRGSVGKPIAGVEVKIATDGEILVKGENVTSGYFVPDSAGAASVPVDQPFKDGWFHTGDIGEVDAEGRLIIKGRKKEMIVTPQGLNVFPEDVERALLAQPGVSDVAVVGLAIDSEERIHAVLILEPGADMSAIVRGANAGLEDHQRVWSTSLWPGSALPRTEGTQKLKRRDIARWASGEQRDTTSTMGGGTSVVDIVRRYAAGRDLRPETTLEEIGLSSLDRVELMMALEAAFQTTLDESALAGPKSIADIETLVQSGNQEVGESAVTTPSDRPVGESGTMPSRNRGRPSPPSLIAFPSWNRSWPAWFLRRISLPTWILPLGLPFMKLTIEGREHLSGLSGPVVFAANHQSHMDGPAILIALPARWRYWLAPAMAKEFFRAHFNPQLVTRKEWFTNSLNYYLSCQFFNAFPLPQREAGTRQTLRYIGEIASDGYSILIFPEGKRNEGGAIGRFMPGVGMIAARLNLPVVPVRIEGLDRVLHPRMRFPKRGPVRVAFGQPLHLHGENYTELAKQVEDAVRSM